jgi:Fe-S oxidoreductase
MVAPLANWAGKNPLTRWLMERMIGVDRRRTLPEFNARPFLRRARETYAPAQPNGRRVVYFVDLFANYNDPELAEAFVKVFNHNGVEVAVPRGQRGCGMPAMDYGSISEAQKVIRHNGRVLRPWVDQGYEVVTSEPTATLSLKDEYLYFVDDENTRALAAATRDAMDYLVELDREGKLKKDFQRPVKASFGYHAPCHLKALHVGMPGLDLARQVPGVAVREIHRGCCGIAGTYGMKTVGYDNSMAAGAGLIEELRKGDVALGMSECSTCKMQMEHGAQKATIHPLKILAHAYGLMDVKELSAAE